MGTRPRTLAEFPLMHDRTHGRRVRKSRRQLRHIHASMALLSRAATDAARTLRNLNQRMTESMREMSSHD